jgi:hypothetical protein
MESLSTGIGAQLAAMLIIARKSSSRTFLILTVINVEPSLKAERV